MTSWGDFEVDGLGLESIFYIEEEPMPNGQEWDWEKVWGEYQRIKSDYAMFAKVALEQGLGGPMEGERNVVINGVTYRWQPYIGGIVYAVENDWQNTKVIRLGDALPNP